MKNKIMCVKAFNCYITKQLCVQAIALPLMSKSINFKTRPDIIGFVEKDSWDEHYGKQFEKLMSEIDINWFKNNMEQVNFLVDETKILIGLLKKEGTGFITRPVGNCMIGDISPSIEEYFYKAYSRDLEAYAA